MSKGCGETELPPDSFCVIWKLLCNRIRSNSGDSITSNSTCVAQVEERGQPFRGFLRNARPAQKPRTETCFSRPHGTRPQAASRRGQALTENERHDKNREGACENRPLSRAWSSHTGQLKERFCGCTCTTHHTRTKHSAPATLPSPWQPRPINHPVLHDGATPAEPCR